MNWSVLITSLISSVVASGIVGLIVRRLIEQSLDLRFSKLREENSAEIRERFRRNAALFDLQTKQLRDAASLVGRMQVNAREAITAARNGWSRDLNGRLHQAAQLRSELDEKLITSRAVLPSAAILLLDQLNNPLQTMADERMHPDEVLPEYASYGEEFVAKLEKAADKIGQVYKKLLEIVHILTGVSTDP